MENGVSPINRKYYFPNWKSIPKAFKYPAGGLVVRAHSWKSSCKILLPSRFKFLKVKQQENKEKMKERTYPVFGRDWE
jgi:hypothetical protein